MVSPLRALCTPSSSFVSNSGDTPLKLNDRQFSINSFNNSPQTQKEILNEISNLAKQGKDLSYLFAKPHNRLMEHPELFVKIVNELIDNFHNGSVSCEIIQKHLNHTIQKKEYYTFNTVLFNFMLTQPNFMFDFPLTYSGGFQPEADSSAEMLISEFAEVFFENNKSWNFLAQFVHFQQGNSINSVIRNVFLNTPEKTIHFLNHLEMYEEGNCEELLTLSAIALQQLLNDENFESYFGKLIQQKLLLNELTVWCALPESTMQYRPYQRGLNELCINTIKSNPVLLKILFSSTRFDITNVYREWRKSVVLNESYANNFIKFISDFYLLLSKKNRENIFEIVIQNNINMNDFNIDKLFVSIFNKMSPIERINVLIKIMKNEEIYEMFLMQNTVNLNNTINDFLEEYGEECRQARRDPVSRLYYKEGLTETLAENLGNFEFIAACGIESFKKFIIENIHYLGTQCVEGSIPFDYLESIVPFLGNQIVKPFMKGDLNFKMSVARSATTSQKIDLMARFKIYEAVTNRKPLINAQRLSDSLILRPEPEYKATLQTLKTELNQVDLKIIELTQFQNAMLAHVTNQTLIEGFTNQFSQRLTYLQSLKSERQPVIEKLNEIIREKIYFPPPPVNNYLDPIMGDELEDPVLLPCGNVINRSTWEGCFRINPSTNLVEMKNPFTNLFVTEDQVKSISLEEAKDIIDGQQQGNAKRSRDD